MNELLTTSLLWRMAVRIAAWLRGCAVGRWLAALGRLWRESAIYRLSARLLQSKTAADGSALRRLLTGRSERLHRHGQGLRRLWHGSFLYRLWGGILALCRRSTLLRGIGHGGMTSLLLCIIALYAPIDWLLRDIFQFALLSSVWDEMLMLLCLCWLLMRRMTARRPLPTALNDQDVFIAFYLLCAFALLSVTFRFADINISGLRASVQYMLLFFLVTRLLRTQDDLLLTYRVMVLSAFFIALYGIWQFVVGVEIPSNWQDQAETAVRTRVFGIFSNPNIMGAYMLLFAPMAIGLAYYETAPAKRAFWWLCGICMCLGCLFTMTRSAWLALAAAAVLFALLIDRKLFFLMLLAGCVACLLPFVRSRIGYLFTPQFQESNARAGRAKRWGTAFGYLDEHYAWKTGLGYGIFGGAVAAQNPINPDFEYMYVDNYYVKILVENGIAGLSALIVMLLGLLGGGVRAIARAAHSPRKALCAGMFAGMVGILIQSFFESLWEEPYMMALFFAVAGMLIFAGFLCGETDKETKES